MHEPDQFHLDGHLEEVLKKARDQLLDDAIDGRMWDFHPHLGTHFLSQYALCLNWLGFKRPGLVENQIKTLLIENQLKDGSWQQLKDVNLENGELNATIFNYWFLKSIGEDLNGRCLKTARDYILARGGIEASTLFTKTFLALFQQFPWQELSRIPYLLFVDHLPSNYKSFSQWLIPHLMPMAYLRAKMVTKNLGERFSVGELWRLQIPNIRTSTIKPNRLMDFAIIRKILSLQRPRGSWGGYTVSTLLSAMSLQHYGQIRAIDEQRINSAVAKGLDFIDGLYLVSERGRYLGCLMDGHYWDTILCANAYLEAGGDLEGITKIRNYILASQQENGGFPYGYDFEYAPDVDDTAQVVLLLANWPGHKVAQQNATDWLLSLQNQDGGWGAFDQDNVGNPILKLLTKSVKNSADLFDDSSADSTGHVLEALAVSGYNRINSVECQRAIRYLRKTQDPITHGWEGRWGVNYLFGTSCSLIGLMRIGESPKETYVAHAIEFLKRAQNADGGFGESTDSYNQPSRIAIGQSTPSQTAWVLAALCHCGLAKSKEAARAVEYLLANFKESGWQDLAVTGTGHPGLLYMNYPSYARSFPLLALGTYRKFIKQGRG